MAERSDESRFRSIYGAPPPGRQRRRGRGCFGVGCLVLLVLLVIAVALALFGSKTVVTTGAGPLMAALAAG